MPLLTLEEETLAREPASFARLMGEREYDARRILLHDRGLSAVYERDPTVHASMQMYIGGHLTWQGGLLYAYRALHAAFKDTSDLAVRCRGYGMACPEPRLITVETVDVAHVIAMAGLVKQARNIVIALLHNGSNSSRSDLLARIPNAERSGS